MIFLYHRPERMKISFVSCKMLSLIGRKCPILERISGSNGLVDFVKRDNLHILIYNAPIKIRNLSKNGSALDSFMVREHQCIDLKTTHDQMPQSFGLTTRDIYHTVLSNTVKIDRIKFEFFRYQRSLLEPKV